ncbi:MAG: hypothetical protein WCD89_26635 [Anaerocolumna sp.]
MIETESEKTEYVMEDYKLSIVYDPGLGKKTCYGEECKSEN